MTKLERELLDEKIAGIHAMITASNDMNAQQHANIMKLMKDIHKETKLTNGRVTKLESDISVIRFFSAHPKLTALILSLILSLIYSKPIYELILNFIK